MASEESTNWVLIKSKGHQNKPLALVAVGDQGVIAIGPLHDFRDFNWDGKVSALEWLTSIRPIVGHLAVESERGAMMREIAMDDQINDSNLYAVGTQVIVKAAFVAINDGLNETSVNRIAKALAIPVKGLNLPAVQNFFVKKGMETVFREILQRVAGEK